MKIPQKTLLIFLGIAGAVFLVFVIFWGAPVRFWLMGAHGGSVLFTGNYNNTSQEVMPKNVGLPIRIKIPKIDVDASMEYVGLTPAGAMAVPDGPSDVAWFDLGPPPGEIGSAVIAGHEGWRNGIAAVFDDLYKLRAGDKVLVENDNGTRVIFVVREMRTYDESGDTSAIFDTNDGRAHLNLITCEGTWNAAKKSYSDRLVVFADKEAE